MKQYTYALIGLFFYTLTVQAQTIVTLDNGMRVYIEQNTSERFISSKLIIHSGSVSDKIPGTAHMTEHLAFQNTEKYSYDFLKKKFGGSSNITMNAMTAHDQTIYDAFSQSSEKNMHEILSVLSQMLLHIKPLQSGLNKERRIVEHERKQRSEKPKYRMLQNHWRNNQKLPKLKITTKKNIQNIELSHIRDFLAEHYRSNNATLILVSDKDEAHTLSLVKKYFNTAEKNIFKPNLEQPKSLNGLQKGVVTPHKKDPQDMKTFNVLLSTPARYNWNYEMAISTFIDTALKDYIKKAGEDALFSSAWVMQDTPNNLTAFDMRIELKDTASPQRAVKKVASIMRDAISAGITQSDFIKLKAIYTISDADMPETNKSSYQISNELHTKSDEDLGVKQKKLPVLTAEILNTNLTALLQPKWFSWKAGEPYASMGDALSTTFVNVLAQPANPYTVRIKETKKDIILKSLDTVSFKPILSEKKIGKNVWLWTLKNGIKVYFYAGKNTTDIKGIKKNTTGYAIDTINSAFSQMYNIPLQGFKAGQVQNYAEKKLGSITAYAEGNSLVMQGSSHALKNADIFSLFHSYLTENIIFEESVLEPTLTKLSPLDNFNKKVSSINSDTNRYTPQPLSSKQVTALYKDFVQNANGYQFIITSNSEKNIIKKYVAKTIGKLKNSVVKHHSLPKIKSPINKNHSLNYTGTGRENLAIKYVTYHQAPYSFINSVMMDIWKYSYNRNLFKTLREDMQITYGVLSNAYLFRDNTLRINTVVETQKNKQKLALNTIKSLYTSTLDTLEKHIGGFKKNAIQNYLNGQYESDKIARFKLNNLVQYGTPYTDIKDDIDVILSIKSHDVRDFMRRYINPTYTIKVIYE